MFCNHALLVINSCEIELAFIIHSQKVHLLQILSAHEKSAPDLGVVVHFHQQRHLSWEEFPDVARCS
jgi:hypothetical protein